MFTSFIGVPNRQSESPFSPPSDTAGAKRKRQQVAKACTQCRLNRSKCDESYPCSKCKSKGVTCKRDGSVRAKTLESANNEIEKLRLKIKELDQTSHLQSGSSSSINTPGSSLVDDLHDSKSQPLDGIIVLDPITNTAVYHGPLSTVLFLNRLCVFLTSALDERILVANFLLGRETPKQLPMGTADCSRTNQESLLNLFWPTYGCLIPVVDEMEFKQQYDALWSNCSRISHPLTDIVLSLCILYGGKFIEDPDKDAASEWYFRRARESLSSEEYSISTVQSYNFITIYLQNVSRHNAAYASLGTAVRIAYSLGLHLNPPSSIPRSDQELRKRIWWELYILDTRLSIELGRPYAIETSQLSLPIAEDMELVKRLGPNMVAENVCWLSYHVQNIKLAMVTRSVHKEFSKIFLQYGSTVNLENSAERLRQHMDQLKLWVAQVPEGLKLKRRDGISFSNDRTPVEVGDAPIWLQLQRISLELLYHTYAQNFQRRFINFIPHSISITPLADTHANTAVDHAVTITNIVHQYLTRHDFIAEWYDIYNMQFNAALTLLVYTIAYPTCAQTPPARKSISMAIENLELFGISNAGALVKALNSKARVLMDRFRTARHVPAAKEKQSVDQNEWLREVPRDSSLGIVNFETLWPDIDYCDGEMWGDFLDELEMGVDGHMGM